MSLSLVAGFATQVDAAPIHDAVVAGDVEELQQVLQNGADWAQPEEEEGCTALMLAASYGHIECVKVLIDHGASVNQTGSIESTALIWAAGGGNAECVSVLIDYGADVNRANNDGDTAEALARSVDYNELAEFIRDYIPVSKTAKSAHK